MKSNKRFTIDIPEEMHYEFKKLALERNVSMRNLMIGLMVSFIHQQNEINNGPTVSNNNVVGSANS